MNPREAETKNTSSSPQPGVVQQLLATVSRWFNPVYGKPSAEAETAVFQWTREPLVAPGPSQPDQARVLQETRALHAERVRQMSPEAITALLGPKPPWLVESDAYMQVFVQQELLLTQGQVIWGALVQANRLLFSPGEGDSAAMVLRSSDAYFDDHPQELRRIGQAFFQLKDTEPADPMLREAARRVSDEHSRSMGEEVVPGLFSRRPLFDNSTLVFRKHLPNGMIAHGLLPILTHPSTPAILILPFQFWTEELLLRWKAQAL
jgi:hypothetical protein